MTLLILGLIIFLGMHVVTTLPELRGRLIARLGERVYRALYSSISIAGFALLIWGFTRAPFVALWNPPVWTRHLALLLMIPAAILVVAAYVPGQIKAKLRHPFLIAVKTWALAHLLANGDLASAILFGTFLAYAVYDRISIKRRQERGLVTVKATGPVRNDIISVVGGIALYAAIVLWLHPMLGPPVLP